MASQDKLAGSEKTPLQDRLRQVSPVTAFGLLVLGGAALAVAALMSGSGSDGGEPVVVVPLAPQTAPQDLLAEAPQPHDADPHGAEPHGGESAAADPQTAAEPATDDPEFPLIAPGEPARAGGRPAESSGLGLGSRTALPPAPDTALVEMTSNGPLPVIAPDGRRAVEVYARPFTPADAEAPRIGLIVRGLGINRTLTAHAIEELPPDVTLGLVPYADDLQQWVNRARAAGHEVLIEIPLEPFDYPQNDTGPQTLLADSTPNENISKLHWHLSRAAGYAGIINYEGGKFLESVSALTPVIEAAGARGLGVFDDGVHLRSKLPEVAETAGVPQADNTEVLDRVLTEEAITKRLREIEQLAAQRGPGGVLAIATAYPRTVEQLVAWCQSLAMKDLTLAPATSFLRESAPRAAPEAAEMAPQ